VDFKLGVLCTGRSECREHIEPFSTRKSWSVTVNQVKEQRNFCLAMITSHAAGEKKERCKNERSG